MWSERPEHRAWPYNMAEKLALLITTFRRSGEQSAREAQYQVDAFSVNVSYHNGSPVVELPRA